MPSPALRTGYGTASHPPHNPVRYCCPRFQMRNWVWLWSSDLPEITQWWSYDWNPNLTHPKTPALDQKAHHFPGGMLGVRFWKQSFPELREPKLSRPPTSSAVETDLASPSPSVLAVEPARVLRAWDPGTSFHSLHKEPTRKESAHLWHFHQKLPFQTGLPHGMPSAMVKGNLSFPHRAASSWASFRPGILKKISSRRYNCPHTPMCLFVSHQRVKG